MSVLTLNAKLDRTESSTPWGFRMQGGKDFNGPLQIQRVNPGSLADRCGVKAGDTILKIGSVATDGLKHKEAQNVIISSGNSLELTLQRGGGSGGATPYVPYQASYNTPAPQSYSSPGSQNLSNQMQGMNISNNQPRAAPVQRAPAKPLEDITQSATYQMLKQSDPAPYRSGDGNNNASSGGRKQSRTFMMLQNMIDSGEELPTPALAKTQNKPQQEEEERYTAVMHSQYNTPIGLYSADNALDTFKGQVKDIVPDASLNENGIAKSEKLKPSETMKLVQQEMKQESARRKSERGSGDDQYFHGSNNPNIQSRSFKYLQTSLDHGREPPPPNSDPPDGQAVSQPAPESFSQPKIQTPPLQSQAPPTSQVAPVNQTVTPAEDPPTDEPYRYTPSITHTTPTPPLYGSAPKQYDQPTKPYVPPTKSYAPPTKSYAPPTKSYATPPEDDKVTAVMHSQYNTPIGLYSATNAYDSFKGQVSGTLDMEGELPTQEAKAIQPSETMRLVQDQDNQPMRRENESTFTGTGSDPIHSRTFKVLQSQMSGGGAPAGPPSQGYKPAPAPAPVTFTPKPAAPKSAPAPWSPPKPAPGGGSGTKFGRKGDASLKREGEGMSGRIPMCVACGATIRGPFILALGKSWCPNHFTCANTGCGMSLVDIGFVEENGQLYCEQDYAKYFAPRCHKCSSAIVGECVKATGHDYHPHCFLCAHCRQPIGKGGFHIEEGQPYCLKDWGDMFQTKCLGCEFAIEPGDRWVEALNGNWHSECFNCSQCQVNLEGQSFYAKHGRPYCKKHAGGF
ncbi:unnamed protein product [Owenia fusiformis]|uniref:Uncharacterized protein n=1 Tax=Owenia fusiformis TaxID=6347 RepID=A0A8J1UKP3_OWEFU|nr:unnamed protein product [Owenia fusiformis]